MKKTLIILSLLLLTITLTSCNKEEPTTNQPTPEEYLFKFHEPYQDIEFPQNETEEIGEIPDATLIELSKGEVSLFQELNDYYLIYMYNDTESKNKIILLDEELNIEWRQDINSKFRLFEETNDGFIVELINNMGSYIYFSYTGTETHRFEGYMYSLEDDTYLLYKYFDSEVDLFKMDNSTPSIIETYENVSVMRKLENNNFQLLIRGEEIEDEEAPTYIVKNFNSKGETLSSESFLWLQTKYEPAYNGYILYNEETLEIKDHYGKLLYATQFTKPIWYLQVHNSEKLKVTLIDGTSYFLFNDFTMEDIREESFHAVHEVEDGYIGIYTNELGEESLAKSTLNQVTMQWIDHVHNFERWDVYFTDDHIYLHTNNIHRKYDYDGNFIEEIDITGRLLKAENGYITVDVYQEGLTSIYNENATLTVSYTDFVYRGQARLDNYTVIQYTRKESINSEQGFMVYDKDNNLQFQILEDNYLTRYIGYKDNMFVVSNEDLNLDTFSSHLEFYNINGDVVESYQLLGNTHTLNRRFFLFVKDNKLCKYYY